MAQIQAKLPANTAIELWWQDEARIGQKNKITRRWAKRGTRPSAPKDQRTQSAYIFGAICPARGVGVGVVGSAFLRPCMFFLVGGANVCLGTR